jgi:hypothetical protein
VVTVESPLAKVISYCIMAWLCAIVVGAMFQLLVLSTGPLALLVLVVGSVLWGVAAGALRVWGAALPAIALLVELAIAFTAPPAVA